MTKITYITDDGTRFPVEADGSMNLMRLAMSEGVPGIEGICGGVLSCATCHVYVEEAWLDKLTPPDDEEVLMLEFVREYRTTSRLCCQITPAAELDGLVVHVPESQ